MKITIVTRLFAEWNVDVDAAHRLSVQWSEKSGQYSLNNIQ